MQVKFYEEISLYFHSPSIALCVLLCDARDPDIGKALLHVSHLNGRSPVCVLLWTVSTPDLLNDILQYSHLNGFSPVWSLL